MLKDRRAIPIVPCSDVARAKRFYTETLGLPLAADMDDVFTLKTGDGFLNVYRSDKAGTNEANAVCWDCGEEMDSIVAELETKSVKFELYPELGMEIRGNLHVDGDFKGAWLKDPDGNILHLNNM